MKTFQNPSSIYRTANYLAVPVFSGVNRQSQSVRDILYQSRHHAHGGQGWSTEESISGGLCIGELSGNANPEPQPAGPQQTEPLDTAAPSPAKHPVAKPLRIMRDKEVWWCDGVKPFQYDVSATLSAGFASGGVFRWDIIKGADKVDLQNGQDGMTKVNTNKIDIKSTDASGATEDITVRCAWSHGNQASTLYHKMTVLAPSDAVVVTGPNDTAVTIQTSCTGTAAWCPSSGRCTATGYLSGYLMEVRDQFGTRLPRDIEINETFDTFKDDHKGNNWPTPNIPPNWTTNARFGDTYGMLSCPGRFRPGPVHPTDKLAHNKIKHATQSYRVGSMTPGNGRTIKHHKAQYYLGHGRQE